MNASKTKNEKIRLFLVDDHAILRQGMKQLLEREKDFVVCGEASGAADALARLPASKADVALVDLGLEGVGGLDLIKSLKHRLPKLSILVVSMFDESLYAERALRAGAHGYIMKHEMIDQVVGALRRVADGNTYLSPAMSERMLNKLSGPETEASPLKGLSDRELQVFRLLGEGLKPAEIAEKIHLSVKTIETYREHIKTKLGLDDASQLSQYAIASARSEQPSSR